MMARRNRRARTIWCICFAKKLGGKTINLLKTKQLLKPCLEPSFWQKIVLECWCERYCCVKRRHSDYGRIQVPETVLPDPCSYLSADATRECVFMNYHHTVGLFHRSGNCFFVPR